MTNAVIIGVGLIGGSLAIDLKRVYPSIHIYGIDANTSHLKKAKDLNIINEETSWDMLKNATLVVLAIPVDAAVKTISKVLDLIGEDTLVIDVGSTKLPICEAAKTHPKRHQFLASHPISGTEFSGPEAAMPHLFKGKTQILCEIEKTAFPLQQKAIQFFSALEMHIRYMHPKAHDTHIAYVSHLSHISAFMLGKTVIEKEKNERDIFDLAGSGFASTVRLAKSSPEMWTPIFTQNKKEVLGALNAYIENLIAFKNVVEADNTKAVYNQLYNTNRIQTILEGIPSEKELLYGKQ